MNAGESAFWLFSLRFYRRPQVAPICLTLQDDHGVDVNILFFLLYLAINQRRLSLDEVERIDAYIQAWRTNIVQPLRAIRRQLKPGIEPVAIAESEALRRAIKRDELHAERLQQQTLERAFPLATTGFQASSGAAAAENLLAYSQVVSAMSLNKGAGLPQSAVDTLLKALAEEFEIHQQTVK